MNCVGPHMLAHDKCTLAQMNTILYQFQNKMTAYRQNAYNWENIS